MALFGPLSEALRASGLEGIFDYIARTSAERISAKADTLTINWLAGEIAHRTELSMAEAVSVLVSVAAEGGPDLRTPKGWACASTMIGAPGAPITPTIH